MIQFYFDNEICQSLKQSTSELPEVVNILYDILAFLRKVCLIIILLSKKRGTASPVGHKRTLIGCTKPYQCTILF